MAETGKFKKLVHTRKYIRQKITVLYNDICNNLSSYDKSKKLQTLKNLKLHMQSLHDSDNKISEYLWDDKATDEKNESAQTKELDSVSEYDFRITEAIAMIEQSLEVYDPNGNSNVSVGSISRSLKPRSAPLPKYSGVGSDSFERFFLTFEAIVDPHNYSDFEKYLLLKDCCTSTALKIVNSLEISKQNYGAAKELLREALASPINETFNTLQRLLDLKLNCKDCPYEFVGEIRSIKELFETLKINIDVVLQFFFWRAMDCDMKDILVQITNTNKPSLSQIEVNIFSAIERYSLKSNGDKNANSSSSKKSVNCAIAVKDDLKLNNESESKKFKCTLCNGDHKYYRCKVYKTPLEKLNRIKVLGGCENCAFLNHKAPQCKLKNLKCKICVGSHFPALCPKLESGPDPINSTNNVVWSSLQCSSGNNLALPTITASIKGVMVRILKDSGAQMNFITELIANKCNLKVVKDDVPLTICGFNSERKCITRIVEIPMSFTGINCSNVYGVQAVVIPGIPICIDLPLLGEAVDKLWSAGYTLADKMLSNKCVNLSNIDVVLGAEASYCTPINTMVLGNENPSAVLDTPYGIMIEGDLNKLLHNLNICNVNFSGSTVSSGASNMKEVLAKDLHVVTPDDSNCSQRDKVVNCVNDSMCERKPTNVNFVSTYYEINGESGVSDTLLCKAGKDILDQYCEELLQVGGVMSEDSIDLNDRLSKFALDNTKQLQDGHLEVPLLWNSKVCHNLGSNYNLAVQVLKSNYKKLCKNPEYLAMTDKVFKEQLEMGIIEKIPDLDKFKEEYPSHSFLPHTSIFRPDKDTTKCRVVYLSNLCEKSKDNSRTICHNQAIYSGPNLNSKLTTSLLLLRFDAHLMIFDIEKAFLNISLNDIDQSRLLLLWYKDVKNANFDLVAYKAKRLPFGISCSPAILMLTLYYILILDCKEEDYIEVNKLVYSLFYVDNGGYSSNNVKDLYNVKSYLIELFKRYKFGLQQFYTNDVQMQQGIDLESGIKTPDCVNLFGLSWNRIDDSISTKKLSLDSNADTKRKVLSSIAENFDPLLYQGPLLNRAKLYLHGLQCDQSLGWDKKLSLDNIREWKNISKQLEMSSPIKISRFVGERCDSYKLICFTDSSKLMYGSVIYIQSMSTKNVNFVLARNHVVNKKLSNKSIPSLELHAAVAGLEVLMDLFRDLTDPKLMCPVQINKLELYSDSMVVLNWIDSYSNKLDKTQNKLNIFVRNRLDKVDKLCEIKSVEFLFVAGEDNPSDMISRAVSYKTLSKSNYYTGPNFLLNDNFPIMNVIVPCPNLRVQSSSVTASDVEVAEHLVPVDRYSSFRKLVKVHATVLKCVERFKLKINKIQCNNENLFNNARNNIISVDQKIHFPDCVNCFLNRKPGNRNMPNLVKQLNLYMDSSGVLRVRSKFGRKYKKQVLEPILLSKQSKLTKQIVLDLHVKMNHSGKYVLLTELRSQFYVPNFFSVVKNVLKDCTICGRFNNNPIPLNQSPYREMRVRPPSVPFRALYLDHLGPISVKIGGKRTKIYLLCFSCMWSRYIDLKICLDLSVESFLRAFQMHVHGFGMPAEVISDSGSSLIAGGNVIKDYIKDPVTQSYLQENGISEVNFNQYFKGNSSLGGLVESAVKLTKRLIFGSIRNNVISYSDFEFLVSEIINLVNKRPVALKESTRDEAVDVPLPITPEVLVHGHVLPTVNCLPQLHIEEESEDLDWMSPTDIIKNNFEHLRKIRANLLEVYEGEFLHNLFEQAIDRKDRYALKPHTNLFKGDVILLKEKFIKPKDYALGIVTDVTLNTNGETTGVTVRKGGTREIVNRHINSIIPLLQLKTECTSDSNMESNSEVNSGRVKRKAALDALEKMKSQ